LKYTLSALGIVLLVLMAMLGALASLRGTLNADALALSEGSKSIDDASAEFKRGLKAVREAEAAGADRERTAILVERLNSVLGMIDEAESLLLKGNVTEADAIAYQTIDISKRIVLEAVELRDEASLRTYYEKIFTFGIVPVASLLLTLGAHFGWKWWRRHEIDRIMRMEKKKEPEEEK